MTARQKSTPSRTFVAIDVAKAWNTVLLETPGGKRRRFKVANKRADHDRLVSFLNQQPGECHVALEPTGMYHRPLAYRLVREGFVVSLVSSLAAARFRDAVFNSWDKNDPKDARVILELLKEGRILHYHDPMIAGIHDVQELSKTYMQVTLARTRLHHGLLTHYLPIYWPEFEGVWCTSRAEWVPRFLSEFPVPAAVRRLDREAFIEKASPLVGRKVNKRAWLEELYEMAGSTIGLPIDPDSTAVQTYRFQLARYKALNELRAEIERLAETTLDESTDFALLKSIPGIGSVLAMVVLAEAGDLRRFRHHRQFLKYCGFDLAKCQSGAFRGRERLSKRGNARLRCAFWFAGRIAVRMRENSFRSKFERYIRADPDSADLKRKAYTAIAAKMARVAHAVIKTQTPYRGYFEAAVPSGKIPIRRAVEAIRTS